MKEYNKNYYKAKKEAINKFILKKTTYKKNYLLKKLLKKKNIHSTKRNK